MNTFLGGGRYVFTQSSGSARQFLRSEDGVARVNRQGPMPSFLAQQIQVHVCLLMPWSTVCGSKGAGNRRRVNQLSRHFLVL